MRNMIGAAFAVTTKTSALDATAIALKRLT